MEHVSSRPAMIRKSDDSPGEAPKFEVGLKPPLTTLTKVISLINPRVTATRSLNVLKVLLLTGTNHD